MSGAAWRSEPKSATKWTGKRAKGRVPDTVPLLIIERGSANAALNQVRGGMAFPASAPVTGDHGTAELFADGAPRISPDSFARCFQPPVGFVTV